MQSSANRSENNLRYSTLRGREVLIQNPSPIVGCLLFRHVDYLLNPNPVSSNTLTINTIPCHVERDRNADIQDHQHHMRFVKNRLGRL